MARQNPSRKDQRHLKNPCPATIHYQPGAAATRQKTAYDQSYSTPQRPTSTCQSRSPAATASAANSNAHDNGQCAVYTKQHYTTTTASSHSHTQTKTYLPEDNWYIDTSNYSSNAYEKKRAKSSGTTCAENTEHKTEGRTITYVSSEPPSWIKPTGVLLPLGEKCTDPQNWKAYGHIVTGKQIGRAHV